MPVRVRLFVVCAERRFFMSLDPLMLGLMMQADWACRAIEEPGILIICREVHKTIAWADAPSR